MKLVFDTNIIHEDFHLYGGRITKLCSAAEKLGYDLMIPDVVVDGGGRGQVPDTGADTGNQILCMNPRPKNQGDRNFDTEGGKEG